MDLMTYLSEMEKLFNKQEIIDEIIKLKMRKVQTQEIKDRIQKLQQKLSDYD